MSWFTPSVSTEAPVRSGFGDLRLYGMAILFAAGNLLLPMAVHAVPNGGLVFLPLFFFTLVAAYAEGWGVGLLVAILSPLLNHALTGMPTASMLPVVLFKSVFLAVAAALLARRLGRARLGAIAGLVVAMQVLGALMQWAISGNMTQAIQGARLGIPGMVLMTLGGFFLLRFIAARRERETGR